MALTILNASSSGLCLGITGTTANRITMQATVESGALHFRILGLPDPYKTAPPRWSDFGDNLHLVRQATSAQTFDIVFRRYMQYIVAGQVVAGSSELRCDWYGNTAFGFSNFVGDEDGPRDSWEDEQTELATTDPPTGFEFGYVEMNNASHIDYLAVRMRRLAVPIGETTTATLKYLLLGGYGASHRDPKVVLSVKTTAPVAADC